MMNEDKYVTEMTKPERGGLAPSAARLQFQQLLLDPTVFKDKKEGERVRVHLDDHVSFQNKVARRKKLIQSEA
eukprot:4991318-Lingulodinium_polyedra.AAC.1